MNPMSASDAQAVLKADQEKRIAEGGQKLKAICDDYKIDLVAQTVIRGNQLLSDVVIVPRA